MHDPLGAPVWFTEPVPSLHDWRLCRPDHSATSPDHVNEGLFGLANHQRVILIGHLRFNPITLLDFSHHLGSFICMQPYLRAVLLLDKISLSECPLADGRSLCQGRFLTYGMTR